MAKIRSEQAIQQVSVIGDGGWGTTLAIYLVRNQHQVQLWGPFADYVRKMRRNRYNPKFLPGVQLPESLKLQEDLKAALITGNIIIFAIPSQYSASILKKIKKLHLDLSDKIFVSVTKGIDTHRLLRVSELIYRELGKVKLAVLSGPTIAGEVARGLPSTAVIASDHYPLAKTLQKVFHSETFRIYTNSDIIGTEIGGSVKNIIALASGVCDGLGFGSNTKAALLTRGLAEMTQLGKKMGGKAKTFSGLAGLGDLITTCFSPQSRNRTVGEQLGKGRDIQEIMASMEMVAEGVETVKAVYKLSKKWEVPMPITTEVYQIIYHHKNPSAAVKDLMLRKTKAE